MLVFYALEDRRQRSTPIQIVWPLSMAARWVPSASETMDEMVAGALVLFQVVPPSLETWTPSVPAAVRCIPSADDATARQFRLVDAPDSIQLAPPSWVSVRLPETG